MTSTTEEFRQQNSNSQMATPALTSALTPISTTVSATGKAKTANTALDDSHWDAFVAAHPQAHILQTSQWAAFKGRFGWQPDRLLLLNADSTIRAGASILYKPLFRTPLMALELAYIPKGPLVDWQHVADTRTLLHAIEDRCRRYGAGILKIEPELIDTPQNRQLLYQYGFQPSPQTIQPQSTMVLDISDGEEAILARMKSKWRYNVRLAKRRGVRIRSGEAADLATFHDLMQTTGERDGFYVHSPEYFNTAFELFVPQHAAYLFAEYEGQPLAAIVLFMVGKTAWYLWGASSNRERNRMPNHALQWAAIQWARERGATRYDLWGIPDPIGQVAAALPHYGEAGIPALDLPIDLTALPRGDLWGVYRLKQGFGGNVVRFVGAWDKALSPPAYALYRAGLAARKAAPRVKSVLTEQIAPIGEMLTNDPREHKKSDDLQPAAPRTQLRQIHTLKEWQSILHDLPTPHLLQSWEWGTIKAQTGWRAERYLLLDDGQQAIGAFQLLTRQPFSKIPLRIGYLPKGPVVDWRNGKHVDIMVGQIEKLVRQRNCLFVKIDPDVRTDEVPGQQLRALLISRGWRFSHEQIQFQNTALSDLYPAENDPTENENLSSRPSAAEERMLANMKSKWRYNIRLAKRRGIKIRVGGRGDLHDFYRLYAETGERDGFLIRPFDYYRTTWQTFLNAQEKAENPAGGALLLAEHDDENAPIAGLFLLRYGDRTWYFYGASSGERRRDMPNYLLQWEAMRWARAQGCRIYDWWGAPTDLDDPDDRMRGVWNFKQGFGAQFQPQIGAWDFPAWPLLYRVYAELMPRTMGVLRKLR